MVSNSFVLRVSVSFIKDAVRASALILVLFLTFGCSKSTNFSNQDPTSRVAYPDTEAGFQTFINELVKAQASSSSVQRQMHSLVIPNSSAWFIEVFGPTTGPTLDFEYRYQLGWQFGRFYAYLPNYARGQNRLVRTEYCEQGHLSSFVTNSPLISVAERPLKIYSGSIATQYEGPWFKLGSFVYIDGTFRFMGNLETEPEWESFHAAHAPYDKGFVLK